AELSYALTYDAWFNAPSLKTLSRAPPGSTEPFITMTLGMANTVVKGGYQIQVGGTAYDGAPPSCNGLPAGEGARGFKAAADPVDLDNVRHFATNAGNIIYEDTASLWAVVPESGTPVSGHPLH